MQVVSIRTVSATRPRLVACAIAPSKGSPCEPAAGATASAPQARRKTIPTSAHWQTLLAFLLPIGSNHLEGTIATPVPEAPASARFRKNAMFSGFGSRVSTSRIGVEKGLDVKTTSCVINLTDAL